LLGHLVAVSDGMLPILGFGERLFQNFNPFFISNPDKSGMEKPTVDELRNSLEAINAKLAAGIKATTTAEWFKSTRPFQKKISRKNLTEIKLNILINRTNHMSYHVGQMTLLKEK